MTKFITFVLSPLGGVFLLLMVAIHCVVTDRRRLAVGMMVVAMGWLYAWSCPVVAARVTRWWEVRYPAVAMEQIPEADVVVTLGGALREPVPPGHDPDLGDAADRVWHAARLYQAGKANVILVSGGGWGTISEAEASVSFLTDLGIPREAIVLEERSMNTIGNARESAIALERMMQLSSSLPEDRERGRSILLVTSAIHMPRAMQAFRHVGLEPIPVPTDFQGVDPPGGWLRWLPSPDALRKSSMTIKELVGFAWYRARYRAPARGFDH